jgi:Arc/MetJ-type ribon-helix-helix transcriptional regulator
VLTYSDQERMDDEGITPRPSQNARGLACALVSLGLCGLWAGGQHFNRAITQRPSFVAEKPAQQVTVAAPRPVSAQPILPFQRAEISHVDQSTGLNARTRDAASAFRVGEYSRASGRLREALREFPGARAEARQSALCYLGASLKMSGYFADADEALRMAIQLAPETDEAQQALKWLRHPARRAVEVL